MDRREFLGKTALAGACLALGEPRSALAGPVRPLPPAPQPESRPIDLVAVNGGRPAALFDRAIQEMGGMKAFVKKGQKVVVKPNIGWDVPPELAANTNPELVARIVAHCKAAGAKEVIVFDHPCDEPRRCYRTSGIEKAARDAGAKVASASEEGQFHRVAIPGAEVLKSAKVHELLLECDVFINVPVLKQHRAAEMTAGMKNLMGVVWDRYEWHRNDLDVCIADFGGWRKPDLIVVDAFRVVKRNGPRPRSAGDLTELRSLVLATDPVAADAAGAKMLGLTPHRIGYIELSSTRGTGHMELDLLNVKKITL
jgi:uncharacterized protein (DUF362 family)